MKLISTCERQFITKCIINKQKRVDGRQLLQGRTLEIVFDKERGCCIVLQGNTRVLVQVSCDISEPKASTPTEGVIHINMEFSAMASPDARTQSRNSEEVVESQRAIERCIRDSKCIDLESMCIVSGSKVWVIRVDIRPLNNDGNLIECASIAAIAALSHFRRPEVTVVGTDVTVHSVEEKEPVALNLHHMPISISLALFDEGKVIVIDPNEIEEKVCDGCYIIGINAHQEICFAHRRGVLLLTEETIQQCEDIAVKRAQEITQTIRTALDNDAYNRLSSTLVGFTKLTETGTILGSKRAIPDINFENIKNLQDNIESEGNRASEGNNASEEANPITVLSDNDTRIGDVADFSSGAKERAMLFLQEAETAIFEGGPSRWGEDLDDDDEEEDEASEEDNAETKVDVSAIKEEISLDSEEETVYVDEDQLDVKTPSRGWYSKDPFK